MTRLTIRELARIAGVSKSTVSAALRNDPRVAAATRSRIAELAAAHGYHPDPALSRIAAQRWRAPGGSQSTIAHLITNRSDDRHDAPAYGAGIAQAARDLGYRVWTVYRSDFTDSRACAETISARGIRGLVLGSIDDPRRYDGMPWSSFVCVAASLGHWRPPLHLVCRDAAQGAILACQRLAAAGYRRPLVVMPDDPTSALMRSIRSGLHIGLAETLGATFHRWAGSDGARGLARCRQRAQPDCAICLNMALVARLRASGGGDLPLVTLKRNRHAGRRIAGIESAREAVGSEAMALLHRQLERNAYGIPTRPLTIMVDTAWVDGESLHRGHNA